MPNRDTHLPKYPTVEFVVDAIADWVNKYRKNVGHADALGQCGPNDVKQIAKELGVSAKELRELASKGPGAADLLQKMLAALNVDPNAIAKTDPAIMRDLQRLCITCSHKKRCERDLAKGGAAAHFHEYCPNAFTLDALVEQQAEATRR